MENTELAPTKPHYLVDVVDYAHGSVVVKSILRKKNRVGNSIVF